MCGKAKPDHPFQQCPQTKCHWAECGEYGHNKWDCPNITCYRCEGRVTTHMNVLPGGTRLPRTTTDGD